MRKEKNILVAFSPECVEYAEPLFGVGRVTLVGPTLAGGSIICVVQPGKKGKQHAAKVG